MYKTTALKQYGVSRNQVECAINEGLIDTKEVKNPYYKSGPPSTLVRVADFEVNLDRVKEFPKKSVEDKEKQKKYRERKKVRDKLEFNCPRCGETVRALKGSAMFEECFSGNVNVEEAQRVLMIAHYRHAHTLYDEKLQEISSERYERYRELREEGFDFDNAWWVVNGEIPDNQLQLKAEYNKEAKELLKQDSLIK